LDTTFREQTSLDNNLICIIYMHKYPLDNITDNFQQYNLYNLIFVPQLKSVPILQDMYWYRCIFHFKVNIYLDKRCIYFYLHNLHSQIHKFYILLHQHKIQLDIIKRIKSNTDSLGYISSIQLKNILNNQFTHIWYKSS